ncbi:hypothetical protein C2G38_2109453 [Gigaspora rosea]|uniref:Uncharacterized protein n=1 Tax=Gigaspora rosea TaxID=44941 RepID=A0A397UFZ3_9GLOM|nr:hypothetical protein C2G38_2109453 [Gigaspora rosea]
MPNLSESSIWIKNEHDEKKPKPKPSLSPIPRHTPRRTPRRTPHHTPRRNNFTVSPPVNLSRWTREEDHTLLKSMQKNGGRWSIISRDISTGRSPIQCCRRWNTIVRCSLRRVALN